MNNETIIFIWVTLFLLVGELRAPTVVPEMTAAASILARYPRTWILLPARKPEGPEEKQVEA